MAGRARPAYGFLSRAENFSGHRKAYGEKAYGGPEHARVTGEVLSAPERLPRHLG